MLQLAYIFRFTAALFHVSFSFHPSLYCVIFSSAGNLVWTLLTLLLVLTLLKKEWNIFFLCLSLCVTKMVSVHVNIFDCFRGKDGWKQESWQRLHGWRRRVVHAAQKRWDVFVDCRPEPDRPPVPTIAVANVGNMSLGW